MDFDLLKRNPAFILSHLKETSVGCVVTDVDTKIIIPKRFAERDLAILASDIYICGIYAIVIGDKYGVSLVNAMIHINPKIINTITIDNIDYYEFFFEKGSNVIESTTIIKKDTLVYYIFDEIISKCNIPCYLNYEDLGNIFDSALYYAGTGITNNKEVTELIVALISRDQFDKTKYYRETVKNPNYLITNPPVYVGLNDVLLGVNSTMSKLLGAYFSDGILSSLVTKTEHAGRIESFLRE